METPVEPPVPPVAPPVFPKKKWDAMTRVCYPKLGKSVSGMARADASERWRMTSQDVEDIVQDAFLKAFRKWESLDLANHDGMSAWLYHVARDLVIDRRRRAEWRPRRAEVANVDDLAEACPEESPFDLELLLSFRSRLPQADQLLLSLRFEGRMGWKAIGAALDCTQKVARRRYLRVLDDLRAMMRGSARLSPPAPSAPRSPALRR